MRLLSACVMRLCLLKRLRSQRALLSVRIANSLL